MKIGMKRRNTAPITIAQATPVERPLLEGLTEVPAVELVVLVVGGEEVVGEIPNRLVALDAVDSAVEVTLELEGLVDANADAVSLLHVYVVSETFPRLHWATAISEMLAAKRNSSSPYNLFISAPSKTIS